MINSSILIVDWENSLAGELSKILAEAGLPTPAIVNHETEAQKALRNECFDLAILNFRADCISKGISLAHKIREEYELPFLLLNDHADSSLLDKILATKPNYYLSKPFQKHDIQAALRILVKSERASKGQLNFKNGWYFQRLPVENILYAQSYGNYIQIQTSRERFTIRYTLDWFIKNVPDHLFLRVHRTAVINLRQVHHFDGHKVVLGNHELPVSRPNIKRLKSQLP